MMVTYCQECLCSLSAEPIGAAQQSSPTEARIEYVPYKIRGASFDELRQDAYRKGPIGPNGRRSPFYTEFHLRCKYDSKYGLDWLGDRNMVVLEVEFKNVVISMSHKITMPVLDDDVALPAQEASRWDQYCEKLKQHEFDHVKISSDPRALDALRTEITAIRKIEFGFSNLPGTIETMAGEIISVAVNAVGNKYITLLKERYARLDDLTRCGEDDYDREEILKRLSQA